MYGNLRTACGYTTSQIDAMLFSDYLELLAYWQKSPPTHLLLKWVHHYGQ